MSYTTKELNYLWDGSLDSPNKREWSEKGLTELLDLARNKSNEHYRLVLCRYKALTILQGVGKSVEYLSRKERKTSMLDRMYKLFRNEVK